VRGEEPAAARAARCGRRRALPSPCPTPRRSGRAARPPRPAAASAARLCRSREPKPSHAGDQAPKAVHAAPAVGRNASGDAAAGEGARHLLGNARVEYALRTSGATRHLFARFPLFANSGNGERSCYLRAVIRVRSRDALHVLPSRCVLLQAPAVRAGWRHLPVPRRPVIIQERHLGRVMCLRWRANSRRIRRMLQMLPRAWGTLRPMFGPEERR
jgi:hypothetical protein